jgi:hypothetical protein
MMIEARNDDGMRAWLAIMSPQVFSGWDGVATIDQAFAKSPIQARKKLAIAVGDVVDFTDDWAAQRVAGMDHVLREANLPTLTAVRRSFSKVISRAVRRGSIKTDVEYYAVRNAVGRAEDDGALWKMLGDYEQQTTS